MAMLRTSKFIIRVDLMVNYLPSYISEYDLYCIFSGFARPSHVRIIRDRAGISLGYGFVTYNSEETASAAMGAMDGFQVGGKILKVAFAHPLNWDEVIDGKLYVGNLPVRFKQKDLLSLFRNYGKILHASIIRNKATHVSKGSGIVRFEATEDACFAMRGLHGHLLPGCHNSLVVRPAISNRGSYHLLQAEHQSAELPRCNSSEATVNQFIFDFDPPRTRTGEHEADCPFASRPQPRNNNGEANGTASRPFNEETRDPSRGSHSGHSNGIINSLLYGTQRQPRNNNGEANGTASRPFNEETRDPNRGSHSGHSNRIVNSALYTAQRQPRNNNDESNDTASRPFIEETHDASRGTNSGHSNGLAILNASLYTAQRQPRNNNAEANGTASRQIIEENRDPIRGPHSGLSNGLVIRNASLYTTQRQPLNNNGEPNGTASRPFIETRDASRGTHSGHSNGLAIRNASLYTTERQPRAMNGRSEAASTGSSPFTETNRGPHSSTQFGFRNSSVYAGLPRAGNIKVNRPFTEENVGPMPGRLPTEQEFPGSDYFSTLRPQMEANLPFAQGNRQTMSGRLPYNHIHRLSEYYAKIRSREINDQLLPVRGVEYMRPSYRYHPVVPFYPYQPATYM